MTVRESDLKPKIEQFQGLNNRVKETELGIDVMRVAQDVDITLGRKVRTRPGYSAPLVACTLGHSLWSDPLLPFALYGDGAELRAFLADETSAPVRAGLSTGRPISYAQINSSAFWSNGAQRGMVTLDLESRDWCCPNPNGQPTVAPAQAGGLNAGDVKVAVTFVDDLGRESGSTLAVELALDGPGGLLLTDIPQPSDPHVAKVRVYVAANGDPTLYLHASLPVGLTTFNVLGKPEGPSIKTQFLEPMPPGHIVRQHSGRLIVARDRRLLWSDQLRYGLYDPNGSWLALPSNIDMAESVSTGADAAGMFVAAGDRTYWLGGRDPRDWGAVIRYPYGAVPGSSMLLPANVWGVENTESVPVWLARNGLFCVGLPGGIVQPINEQQFVSDVGERAAALFKEADGIYQFIVAHQAATTPKMAVGDAVTVRTYRYNTEDETYTLEGEPPPEVPEE